MPYTLTNREAAPVQMEELDILGQYIQGGDCPVDYYNDTGLSILPGEPILFLNKIMISKSVILPGEFGSLVAKAWMRYLVDPELAAAILQGDPVYLDLDLADDDLYLMGYATGVEPTNGMLLGYAIAPHAKGAEIRKTVGGAAVAAGPATGSAAASLTVDLLMDDLTPTTYGTGSGS